MVKKAKHIDFYTTGRQPSDKDFKRISEWICKRKKLTKTKKSSSKLQAKLVLHGIDEGLREVKKQ